MSTVSYISIFVGLAVVSAGLVWLLRRWTLKRGVLDIPNERSSHTEPTPRGGGIVIAVLTLVTYSAWMISAGHPISIPFIVGSLIVVIISWLDDLYSVPVVVRFLIHAAAASQIVLGAGYYTRLTLSGSGEGIAIPFAGLLTFLAVIWLVNAYNFMDGIDGIAAVQAITAAVGWLLIGMISSDLTLLSLGLAIAATNVGFLIFNWQPAKIFMGDAGSAFLGFSFAVLPLLGDRSRGIPAYTITAVLLVWPFVFDSVFTFFSRLLRREKVWKAHRSHIYQRLVISGMSHASVTTIYGAIALVITATTVYFGYFAGSSLIPGLLAAAASSVLLIVLMLVRSREAV